MQKCIYTLIVLASFGFVTATAAADDVITSSDPGVAFTDSNCFLQGYEVSEVRFFQDQFDYLEGMVTVTMDCADYGGRRYTTKRTEGVWLLAPEFDPVHRVWTLNGREIAHAFNANDVRLAEGIQAEVWSDTMETAIVFRIDLIAED